MQSRLPPTDMLLFEGDALVIPCYSDVLHSGRYAKFMQKVLEEAGPALTRELSALGSIEQFHAFIVQGQKLPVRHLIFYACLDDDPDFTSSSLDWHAIWKNVVTLARMYHLKKLGIKLPTLVPSKRNLLYRIGSAFQQKALDGDVITILSTILKSDKKEEQVEVSLFL